eukprot:246840_1
MPSRHKKIERRTMKKKRKKKVKQIIKTSNTVNPHNQLSNLLYFYYLGYHRESVQNVCRKNALLAIMSCLCYQNQEYENKNKNIFTMKQFNTYCDSFDKLIGVKKGLSRQFFMIGNNSNNIFSYIFKKHCNLESEYIPISPHSNMIFENVLESEKYHYQITKTIIFNYGHAWAMIKHGNNWYGI